MVIPEFDSTLAMSCYVRSAKTSVRESSRVPYAIFRNRAGGTTAIQAPTESVSDLQPVQSHTLAHFLCFCSIICLHRSALTDLLECPIRFTCHKAQHVVCTFLVRSSNMLYWKEKVRVQ